VEQLCAAYLFLERRDQTLRQHGYTVLAALAIAHGELTLG
jgi:hypothetical protein